MFNAMTLASLTIFVSLTGTPCVNSTPVCGQSRVTISQLPGRGQIGYARAFVGGQDVIQITRADSRRTPFMDVKASDLLISYVYDKEGRMIDRKVWYEKETPTMCSVMSGRSMF